MSPQNNNRQKVLRFPLLPLAGSCPSTPVERVAISPYLVDGL